MERYNRLNIDLDYLLNCDTHSINYAIDEMSNSKSDSDIAASLQSDLFHCICISVMNHLGYRNDWGTPVSFAEQGAAIAIDYFYGDWREGYIATRTPLTAKQCRRRLPWIDQFREGLVCSILSGEWQSVDRLVKWIDNDLKYDEGTLDSTQEDNYVYMALAIWMRTPTSRKIAGLTEKIRRGRPRRPKILLDTLESIMTGDSVRFEKALKTQLSYFEESEFRTNRLDCCISLDASVIWEIARRANIRLPEIPIELMDLIMTSESLDESK